MLDWNLAKKGASVVLRCGGRIELEKDADFDDGKYFPYIVSGKGYEESYKDSGLRNWNGECALDIIAIEPAPEPKRNECFINFYDDCFGESVYTLEKAKELARGGTHFTLRITCTDDPNNPDPTIEVVK